MNVDTSSEFKIIYSGALMTLTANLSQSQYVGFGWIRKSLCYKPVQDATFPVMSFNSLCAHHLPGHSKSSHIC